MDTQAYNTSVPRKLTCSARHLHFGFAHPSCKKPTLILSLTSCDKKEAFDDEIRRLDSAVQDNNRYELFTQFKPTKYNPLPQDVKERNFWP